jgi:hypothetical protein
MVNLLKSPLLAIGAMVLVPLFAAAQTSPYMAASGQNSPYQANPGTVNYVEGQASIDGNPIGTGSLRSTTLAQGQTLETGPSSKAEILLTPGVILRVGDNSAVQMVSPSITNTQVALQRGSAMVEVDQIEEENHLVVTDNGTNVVLEKKGLYSFNTAPAMVAVYDGKAHLQIADKSINLDKGREVMLQAGAKAKDFNIKQGTDLYAWSKLRSEYMAQANGYSAQTIMAYDPGWFWGTGWYWNPYFDTWAFVPGAGYLYSPFGFGFFSPAYVGVYGYPGFYGFHGYHGTYPGFRGNYGYRAPAVTRFGGGFGGFHGGVAGGFHGGGFAGGRR